MGYRGGLLRGSEATRLEMVRRSPLMKVLRRVGRGSHLRVAGFHPIRQEDVTWIFGSARSGSTWLTEMLGDLGAITWPEPHFGLLFAGKRPDLDGREDYFFHRRHREAILRKSRELFFEVASEQFGSLSEGQRLVVKDINAYLICPDFADLFPSSRYLFLSRDPFDIVDSILDMQKPGAWNEGYESGEASLLQRAIRAATDTRASFETALDGYERVSPELRYSVRYEDLIDDPEHTLERVGAFCEIPFTKYSLDRAVEKNRFEKHAKTGEKEFRRFGRAGVWQSSPNFTDEVHAELESRLGDLRERLGYATRA